MGSNESRPGPRGALGLALLCLTLVGFGPCGPIPGGEISGTKATTAPADWSHTDALSTVQVETRPGDPYSVTTWCVTDGTTLWVPSRGAARKKWVENASADPRVRLGIDGTIFEMTATRVTDPEEQRRIVGLLRAKYSMARWSMDEDPARSPDTWYFRMTPR